MEEYIFYKTFYDKNEFKEVINKLNASNIKYKYKDKSNLPNYRIPLSTFNEIDLFIHKDDFDKVKDILDEWFSENKKNSYIIIFIINALLILY